MFTFGVLGCWGNAVAEVGGVPTTPVLTLEDKEDGTGFIATLSGEDSGTTNTLYVMEVDETVFASEGTDWDSNGQMEVTADVGRVFCYVVSANEFHSAATEMETVLVTGDTPAAASDNINVAVRAMKQTAVYWPSSDDPDEFGQPTYEDPVEIDCRWETVREEFVGPTGDPEVSKAKLIVDRDMSVKDMILLGDLDSVIDPDDPRSNDGAWEVRLFRRTPNFKGTKFLREVYL